jgi:hypothetical protein
MEEPKVDTEETRDTSAQQGSMEEEPSFHSDLDQDADPPKESWAN